jgi:hypothetical protein
MMVWLKLAALAAFNLTIFCPAVGKSALQCSQALNPSLFMAQENAIEKEIGASDSVIELFTTTDGTIRPLFLRRALDHIPEQLLKDMRASSPEGILNLEWDLFTPQEKRLLLMAAAKANRINFGKNRVVPGLKYRDQIQLTFREPSRFLGRDFLPGTYSFSSNEIFGHSKIEYMGFDRSWQNLGFELHLRTRLSAGENYLSARAFEKALVGEYQALHQHLVAPYPKLAGELGSVTHTQRIAAFRIGDFKSRVNLFFAMKMIRRKITLRRIKANWFADNFLVEDQFSTFPFVESLVSDIAGGGGLPESSKAGLVGSRTRHFYDGSEWLWGIEIRYLPGGLDHGPISKELSVIQKKMLNDDLPLSYQDAYQIVEVSKRPFDVIVEDLSYKNMSNNISLPPFWIKKFSENDFLHMLFTDWSALPIYFNKPRQLAQMGEAQVYARKLVEHGMPSTEAMLIFIKRSGLEHLVSQDFR